MQQQNAIIDTDASTTISIQLASSFLVAGGAGLIAFHGLSMLDLSQAFVVILALTCSVGIGLLATANIQYGMFLLHLALDRLAEGKPVDVSRSFWLWPLGALFHALGRANLKIDEISKRERLTDEYREQLLRQASEAAAIEERNHLARDLHDSIKQQLFSIRMSAIAAKGHMQVGVAKAQEALEDILRSTNEAQVEMQALLQQLRSAPLEHVSLAEAVHTQAQALEYRSGAHVSVDMADLPSVDRCPPHMQEVVFRIVKEAFANIARHARARCVSYTQTQDEEMLVVTIHDDGQGFDTQTARKGMGLANIQERVNSLGGATRIESEPGEGTTLSIQIPLLSSPEAKQQREQEEYESQRIVEQAYGGLQLRSAISVFTLAALASGLGLFTLRPPSTTIRDLLTLVLGLCLLLMLYGLISAHLALVRLKHYRGDEDRGVNTLALQVHMGWAGFLRLFLFITWQIMFWELNVLWTAPWWETRLLLSLFAGAAGVLLLLEHRRTQRAQDHYYPLLSSNLLGWEVRHRWQVLRLRFVLGLCLGIILVVGRAIPFFVPLTPLQWLRDYLLFAFFVLCIGIVADVRQIQPWRKLAKITL
ncbi:MAG TPA: sensor histidine kinase [Ktedonobacteraceae bacterium]